MVPLVSDYGSKQVNGTNSLTGYCIVLCQNMNIPRVSAAHVVLMVFCQFFYPVSQPSMFLEWRCSNYEVFTCSVSKHCTALPKMSCQPKSSTRLSLFSATSPHEMVTFSCNISKTGKVLKLFMLFAAPSMASKLRGKISKNRLADPALHRISDGQTQEEEEE